MDTEKLIYSYTSSKTNYSRRELKYYISEFQYRQLLKVIHNYMLPDENVKDKDTNSYPIRSLYLESMDLKCYHERMDGIKIRAKYRYRTYEEDNPSEDADLFMEIKKKINKDLYKRRAKMKFKDLHKVLEKGGDYDFIDVEKMTPQGIRNLNDFLYFKDRFKLSPFIGIRYKREAYYDKESRHLRLSFDRDMYARAYPSIFGLTENLKSWVKIEARDIIFEIKTRTYLPQWMIDLINRFSLVAEPISKYCICVEALRLHR